MKIAAIRVHQVDLPLKEGRYAWADGKFVDVFDSTIVEVITDDGHSGFGEVCPLGPFYLPAYGPGARAGILELAPHLMGLDPSEVGVIERAMDRALLGHPYVKSALDMACWDLLGQRAGLPVCALLGGRFGDAIALYRAITQLPPDEMAANLSGYRDLGYTKFQLKVGGDPRQDVARIRACTAVLSPGDVLVADANTGWRSHEALQVVNAVRDIEVFIEQPCVTYEECLGVRARCVGGRARRIEITNVASFADRLDASLEVEGLGTLTVDTAYGGDSFVIVDAVALGFAIVPDEARDLAEHGVRITRAADEQLGFAYPGAGGWDHISFCQFAGPLEREADGTLAGANAVTVRPGKIDRSPTGTGCSARMAVLHARGHMAVGGQYRARSIIGSHFDCTIAAETSVEGRAAIIPTIAGRAWITGTSQLMLDPEDPWPSGYRLSDTWPRMP